MLVFFDGAALAFVIFSTGGLTSSRTRTLSLRSVAFVCVILLVLAVLSGVKLGRTLAEPVDVVLVNSASVQNSAMQVNDFRPEPLRPSTGIEPRSYLMDRYGELSARLIELETEAANLAGRIDAVKEFEERIRPNETIDIPLGRPAKTQPGLPSGGPLLQPQGASGGGAVGSGLQSGGDVFDDEISRLQRDLERLANVFSLLDQKVMAQAHQHLSFPGRAPVAGVNINSGFGNRRDPFNGRRAFHSGVDYAAPRGTTIRASAGGRVIFSGQRPYYGQTIEIDHGGGLVTRYAHASRLLVSLGEVVMPLQEIALIGATGRATGPHLHFEVLKDGHFVDPAIYLSRF